MYMRTSFAATRTLGRVSFIMNMDDYPSSVFIISSYITCFQPINLAIALQEILDSISLQLTFSNTSSTCI